jgi:phenylpropionate dioxygenase-like ring-hydroxylating dioxygenase large terminal subunit
LKLFLKLPVLAHRSCDLPDPGNLVTFDAAGPSIVMARDESGEVAAFIDVCMHPDGKLAAIPGKVSFEDVDEKKHR